MKQQLYREVNDGVGTKLIEVSEEEVKAATNCNNITWIIKYLPKSRVGFFISSMTW